VSRPLLTADGLAYAWGDGRPLFSGLELAVAEGEIVVLLGSSGSGKSTLLKVLAGLARPLAGVVRFDGAPLDAPQPRIALLFQRPGLLPWLRVDANVAFGLDFTRQPRLPAADRAARVAAALHAVGLSHAAALRPAQLSGGMAQRVAVARALAREPRLILADEPFSALDAITRADMQILLRDAARRRGAAVLLVTHDLDEALAIGDRVLLLGRGRLAGAWPAPGPAVGADERARLRDAIRSALQATRDHADPPIPVPEDLSS
jgi:NitT/TauT family transport system ATP-binding protein